MPTKSMNEEMKRALAARVRFYRELGIDDFYLRPGVMTVDVAVQEYAEPPEPPVLVEAEIASLPAPPDKLTALAEIRALIGDCTRCRLAQGRTTIVFADGNPDADIMFVGEGPGADEDAQGLPFVGKAGQLLNNMI